MEQSRFRAGISLKQEIDDNRTKYLRQEKRIKKENGWKARL